MRLACREADRDEPAKAAANDALVIETRGVAPRMLSTLCTLMDDVQPGLFNIHQSASSATAIGGNGTALEESIVQMAKCMVAEGRHGRPAVVDAVDAALKHHCGAIERGMQGHLRREGGRGIAPAAAAIQTAWGGVDTRRMAEALVAGRPLTTSRLKGPFDVNMSLLGGA